MSVVDDPLPDLIRGMRSNQPEVRSRSARALGRMGEQARDAMPHLAHALHDQEASVRESAAQAMGQMGPEAIPHLTLMLQHDDKYVRRNAVWALGKLGHASIPTIPYLCQALRDADPRVASGAAQTLGGLAEQAAEAIGPLTEAMRGTNIVLCRLAAKALSEIGLPALPSLIAHLRHRDPFVRGEAALAVGWMGANAVAAIPMLLECLRSGVTAPAPTPSSDQQTRPELVVPKTEQPTAEESSRMYSAQALGRIGPTAAVAIPALKQALQDPHDQVRQAALLALRAIQNG
ncbi:MAG: HEAT repeat domain-containing protein [Fimbriiglobus sp.]